MNTNHAVLRLTDARTYEPWDGLEDVDGHVDIDAFLTDNADDTTACLLVRCLDVGQTVVVDGFVGVGMRITRVS